MNRHYTTEQYSATVNQLRKTFKDVSITTDIIAGFPGETDEEFNSTFKFLEDIRLSKMHVFKYSSRKGTRAENLPDQVPPEVKESRSQRLIDLDRKFEREFIEGFIGSIMDILFEDTVDGRASGYTKNYIRVSVPTTSDLSGQIHEVKLLECMGNEAAGEIVRR
jgi:threonylcarbamoyladenosine tRNA methylthiotransferase MtaB